MATIAVLNAMFTSDTRGLTRGLREAQNSTRRTGRRIGRETEFMRRRFRTLTAGVFSFRAAIGALAGTAGIGLLVRSQMRAIDQTAKFADMIGVSTQELTGLQHAAELTSGMVDGQFRMALQRMTRRIAEAAEGTGEAKDAIAELGLSAQELDRMGPAQAFRAIAGAMQSIESEGQRVRIAFKLFDSEGAKLVNTLSAGTDQIDRFVDRAERLGIAFTRLDAAKVEQANDAITGMASAFSGVNQRLAIELAPAITIVANHITESFTAAGANMRRSLGSAVEAGVQSFGTLLTHAGSVIRFISDNPATAQFGVLGFLIFGRKGAAIGAAIGVVFETIRDELRRLGVGVDDTAARLSGVREELAKVNAEVAAARDAGQDPGDIVVERGFGQTLTLLDKQRELTRTMMALEDQLTETGRADLRRFFEDNEGAANSFANSLTRLGEQLQNFRRGMEVEPLVALPETPSVPGADGGQGAAERAREQQERRLQVLREGAMSERELEQEQFFLRQEQLAELREMDLIGTQEHLRLLESYQRQHEQRLTKIAAAGMTERQKFQAMSMRQQAKTIFGELATITAGVAQHNKTLFRLNQAAGIANAIINAYEGISRTLSAYPYPLNIAMAAAHATAAFAQVQAIRSASFQGGGSGAAPALSGTTPAQPVTPVESVAERRDEEISRKTNLTIRMEGRGDPSRRDVERMFDKFNELIDDGWQLGRVKLA